MNRAIDLRGIPIVPAPEAPLTDSLTPLQQHAQMLGLNARASDVDRGRQVSEVLIDFLTLSAGHASVRLAPDSSIHVRVSRRLSSGERRHIRRIARGHRLPVLIDEPGETWDATD